MPRSTFLSCICSSFAGRHDGTGQYQHSRRPAGAPREQAASTGLRPAQIRKIDDLRPEPTLESDEDWLSITVSASSPSRAARTRSSLFVADDVGSLLGLHRRCQPAASRYRRSRSARRCQAPSGGVHFVGCQLRYGRPLRLGGPLAVREPPRQFECWNLAKLSEKRLHRKFPVRVSDRLRSMTCDRIQNILGKPMLSPKRFDSVTPGVAWG